MVGLTAGSNLAHIGNLLCDSINSCPGSSSKNRHDQNIIPCAVFRTLFADVSNYLEAEYDRLPRGGERLEGLARALQVHTAMAFTQSPTTPGKAVLSFSGDGFPCSASQASHVSHD